MLESTVTVPLHFTIEFLGFLVFAGGAGLVLTRPEVLRAGTFGRGLAALGLAVLAFAQFLHGAAYLVGDGNRSLALARAVGLMLLAVGLMGAPKAQAAAFVGGLEVKEPFLAASATASLLVAVAAWNVVRRGGPPALRRLSAGAALLAASEALTALAPRVDFGAGTVNSYALAAHGIKLLAFLAIGWWLASAAGASIRTRFVASFAVLLVVVVLTLSTALSAVISSSVSSSELDAIASQLDGATSDIDDSVEDLSGETGQIATLSDVRSLVASGQGMRDLVDGIDDLEFFDVDFVAVLDRRGANLANTTTGPRLENARGEAVTRRLTRVNVLDILGSELIADLVDRGAEGSASLDVLPNSGYAAILAGAPVRSPDGSDVVGFLITARWLDLNTVEEISASTDPARATLVIGRDVLASALAGGVTGSELVSPEINRSLAAGESERRQLSLRDRAYFGAFAPLLDARRLPTGAALSLASPSFVVATTREAVIEVLFLVAMGVAAVVLVLAWFSGRRITRPISQLTTAAQAVRAGDLSAKAPVGGDDEVGRLGATFNDMIDALLGMTDDLRRAAREEQELRARIETIIQSMADALIAVDREGKVLAFNAEAEVMTQTDAADALGHPLEEVVTLVDAQGQEVRLPIHDLSSGSVGGVFLQRRRGDPVPVAATSAVLRDDAGEIAGGVAVLRDMTRERQVERMKSEFLSNISHELRTPLTPIKGYADLLGRAELPPEKARQFAVGIQQSTFRLERIVALLVDFAAMEAGRLAPKHGRVNLSSMLGGLAGEWDERTPRHHVVADLSEQLPEVIGDERLLRRSLEELLDNAVKFSPQGGTIRLVARDCDGSPDSHSVEVVVEDEGIGIDSEDLPRLFSDFQQLDGSQTRPYGGLGLGLAFVRRIIEAHEGTIEVTSRPQHGTTLTIRLPVDRSRNDGGRGPAED